MYKCYEIKLIFANCENVTALFNAIEVFDDLVTNNEMTPERQQFIRHESIVRLRQLQALKPKR